MSERVVRADLEEGSTKEVSVCVFTVCDDVVGLREQLWCSKCRFHGMRNSQQDADIGDIGISCVCLIKDGRRDLGLCEFVQSEDRNNDFMEVIEQDIISLLNADCVSNPITDE